MPSRAEPPRLLFYLPSPTPSLNVLQRLHWQARRRLRDGLCLLIRAQLPRQRLALSRLHQTGHRQVELLRCSRRRLDWDNLVGGAKITVDCLVRCGLLVDDGPDWLTATYRQEVSTTARTLLIVWAPWPPRDAPPPSVP